MTYIFDEYGERHRFDAFCKTVLRYEAINYFRELNRQRNYSIQFSALSQSELKNSIIYFLIYKERCNFLNIIAIVVCCSTTKFVEQTKKKKSRHMPFRNEMACRFFLATLFVSR